MKETASASELLRTVFGETIKNISSTFDSNLLFISPFGVIKLVMNPLLLYVLDYIFASSACFSVWKRCAAPGCTCLT